MDPIAVAVLLVLLLAAAWFDVTQRRVPNWLSAVTLVAGLVAGFLQGGGEGLMWHGAHAGLALLAGMALFALKMWGGGDGKFYAAAAAWFPLQQGFALLLSISLAGLVLLVIWMVGRPFRGMATDKSFRALPYAVAIAGGAAVMAVEPLL